jgi:hypothetical protein
MKRLRDQEGELLVDHRNSPGVPAELLVQFDLPLELSKHSKVAEFPTFTCKHCQTVVIMNPERTRQRNFCKGCNHLICDPCAAIKHRTGVCKTFDQIADELMNQIS